MVDRQDDESRLVSTLCPANMQIWVNGVIERWGAVQGWEGKCNIANGNPQDCQPQNWLLVDNPEVGNSEYAHYSGLPTPIIYRNSGYNAPQPTLISTW